MLRLLPAARVQVPAAGHWADCADNDAAACPGPGHHAPVVRLGRARRVGFFFLGGGGGV